MKKLGRALAAIGSVAVRACKALASVNWYFILTRLLVLVPVLICFTISASIEVIVFQSILTVLGFEMVALFLALSLELFKLIIPLMIVSRAEGGSLFRNSMVVALRLVLFVISFACTFIAISNNLVDTNAEAVAAQNNQITTEITQEFRNEYARKQQAVNELANQKSQEKRDAYRIESREEQLAALNETYAQSRDWATYSLILELNNALTEAQNQLNADLNAIEEDRTAQLEALAGQYSDAKLQAAITEGIARAQSSDKYDQTQNTNITKAMYLIESTFHVSLNYETVVVFIAILICFASECIIWTGSAGLIVELERRYMPSAKISFDQEFRSRLEDGADAARLSTDTQALPSIVLYDESMMKKLAGYEKLANKRKLRLVTLQGKYQYQNQIRAMRRQQKHIRRQQKQRTAFWKQEQQV